MTKWKVLCGGDEEIQAIRREDDWWWLLRVTDLERACGKKEAEEISGRKGWTYAAELFLVPGPRHVSDKKQEEVLGACCPDPSVLRTEEVFVQCAAQYGLAIPVAMECGTTPRGATRRLLREADVDYFGSIEHLLGRPVNFIGQTGLEYVQGDFASCAARAKASPAGGERKIKFAVLESQAGAAVETDVKMVRYSKLSTECWFVQVWGLEKCEDCESRDTPDCGGQNIRKTGKNRYGHEVPVA